MSEKAEVFLRKASGMVRNVSGIEAMLFNISFMGFLFICLELPFTAGLYPGVNIPIAAALVIPMSLCIAAVYGLLTAAMPRSGGEYVTVGRILHPALGFMSSFYVAVILFSWFGTVASWIPQFGFGSLFASIGTATGDAAYLDLAGLMFDPMWSFAITAIVLFIGFLVVLVGSRVVVKAAWACFALTIVGIIAYAVALGGTGYTGFVENFNSLSGTTYSEILTAGRTLASVDPAPFPINWSQTFLGTVFIFLGTIGYTANSYCAGEVKGKLTHLYSMLGSLILFGLIVWPLYFVIPQIMGGEFVNSLSHLAIMEDAAYWNTIPAFPSLQYLAVFLTQNVPILTIIHIGFMATTFASPVLIIPFLFTRNLFAWSFDRLLPTGVAKVDRRGNPWIAAIIVLVVAQISNYIAHFTTAFDFLAYGMLGWFIVAAITSFAGAAFPYTRKDIFETSPPSVRKKIAGIPVITILGIISFIVSIYIAYATISPGIAGVLDPTYIAAIAITLIAGPIYYAIIYLYQRRRGIPIQLAHKRLPPE